MDHFNDDPFIDPDLDAIIYGIEQCDIDEECEHCDFGPFDDLPSLDVTVEDIENMSLRAEECDQFALSQILCAVAAARDLGLENELCRFTRLWCEVQDRRFGEHYDL